MVFNTKKIMNLTVSTNPSCIKDLESTYFNSNVPKIKVGDSVKIGVSIAEGNKERIQFSEGVVIAKSNAGLNTTIIPFSVQTIYRVPGKGSGFCCVRGATHPFRVSACGALRDAGGGAD